MQTPVLIKARKMHHDGTLYSHPMCKQCYMGMNEAVVHYYKERYKEKFVKLTDKIRGKSSENI